MSEHNNAHETRNSRILGRLSGIRPALVFALQDAILLTAATGLALLFRYDGDVAVHAWAELLGFLPIAIVVFVGINGMAGVYGQLWRYASVVEARRVLVAGCASTGILVVVD